MQKNTRRLTKNHDADCTVVFSYPENPSVSAADTSPYRGGFLEQLSGGYFVAENAEDILRHEMHHKDHWDRIEEMALTTGRSRDMVKQEMEAELREYINRQLGSDRQYIRKTVSGNASDAYLNASTLNELIADALLQIDKGVSADAELLRLVRGCIE